MPLRATRIDGEDHPGAALKSRLPSLLAWAPLSVGSACLFPGNRECDPRDGSSRIRESTGADALVHGDDMIQNFSPTTAHPSFRQTILPWRLNTGSLGLQTGCLQKPDHVSVDL